MIKAQKLGPGSLKLGETGTDLDLSCQMTEVRITWDTDEGDSVSVLCGDTIPGDDTYTATLEGTVMQDFSAGGVIDYSWSNKGAVVPVEFVPTTGNAEVRGRVKITPIDMGGEVNKKNDSDLSWVFVGEPEFTPLSDETSLE